MASSEFNRLIEIVEPKLPEALFNLSAGSFEDLIMDLFDRGGYQVAKIGRSTFEGDGGIDVIAYSRERLAGDLRIAIQCKATKNRIQPRLIREFNTSLQNFKSHKGVFVTTSDFTSGATNEVRKSGYPIELMDYVKLSNKIRGTVVKK